MQKFEDHRGVIETICHTADVLRITSKPGTRRANHFHKSSGHWCFVVRGSIRYYEREIGATENPDYRVIKTGEMFWTGPMVAHLMVFEEETEFFCFSTGKRNQLEYETDLVRLDYNLDECIL